MGTSQERRPCRESNATWTGPLSEAMPACRGRRADHAQKDRVGTWEIPRWARAIPLLVRIGKGKPIADDERTREVGPSSSSCEAGEQGGAIRRGAGGAKGWDQGECKPATLGPDAEPGNRVTGAGTHTSNRKGKEEGTVHSALPPYQRRTAPGCVLCHQAGGSPRRRRGGMAGLRGKCGDKSPWLARARPTGSVSGTAVPASVHTQAGRPAAPARGRRPGRQGSVISPLLANIYVFYVLDLYAEHWRRREASGDVIIVRYADDFIIGFEHETDAKRFLDLLRERMGKFALALHPEKTRLIEFGRMRRQAADSADSASRKPSTSWVLPSFAEHHAVVLPDQAEVPERPHAGKAPGDQAVTASADAPADPRAGEMAETGRRRILQVSRRPDQQPCPDATPERGGRPMATSA